MRFRKHVGSCSPIYGNDLNPEPTLSLSWSARVKVTTSPFTIGTMPRERPIMAVVTRFAGFRDEGFRLRVRKGSF